jgi:hypothetical protein
MAKSFTIKPTGTGKPAIFGRGGNVVRGNSSSNIVSFPDMVEDFSTYSNTAEFLSDPRNIYQASEEVLTNTNATIELDTSVGYAGRTKSMRQDFFDATADVDRCTNGPHSVRRVIEFPGAVTQVWAEVYVRFSADFNMGGGDWGCVSAPEHKLIFFGVNGTSRFNLMAYNGQWTWGYPNSEDAYISYASPTPSSLFDEEWHQFRFHLKLSSATDVADGIAKWWLDGNLRANLTNVVINKTDILNIFLGQTRNQGAPTNIEMWFGLVNLYYGSNDPGWV